MTYDVVSNSYVRDEVTLAVLDVYIPHMKRSTLVQHTGIGRHRITLSNRLHMTATDLYTHTGTTGTEG